MKKQKPLKYDSGKTRWDLLCYDILDCLAEVMTYGSIKYNDRNWTEWDYKSFIDKYFSATMHHLRDYKIAHDENDRMKKYDEESKLHHLSHAFANVMMLFWFERHKNPIGKDQVLEDERKQKQLHKQVIIEFLKKKLKKE